MSSPSFTPRSSKAAQGCPDAPLAYARDYDLHYPKVGICQWPPLFYAAQALWTLVGGDSASSLHAFAATLAALTATALFALLRPRVGALGAGLAALAFLALPLVQTFSGTLMTEMQLALCCTLAVGAFARFLASGARSALVLLALAALIISGPAIVRAQVLELHSPKIRFQHELRLRAWARRRVEVDWTAASAIDVARDLSRALGLPIHPREAVRQRVEARELPLLELQSKRVPALGARGVPTRSHAAPLLRPTLGTRGVSTCESSNATLPRSACNA